MWRRTERPEVASAESLPELATIKKVIAWLDKRQSAKNPFFMFVNLNCAHLPYTPPDPFLSRFLLADYDKEEVNRAAAVKSMWPHLAGELKLSERDFHIMSDLYDGEIAFDDYCVGQIGKYLESLGIFDETVVVVTSDHGENIGEHGRIDHTLSMHETILHIPLLIRYPGRFQPGVRINDLVSIVDIAPTILDLCSVRGRMGGLKSAETSLARDDRPRRAFVVAENERPLTGIAVMEARFPNFDTSTIDYRMRAIRSDSHKLIWNVGRSTELFDLRTDPGELRDLADVEIETRNKLHRILTNWMSQIPTAGDISFLESQDEESLKILRSLGYIE